MINKISSKMTIFVIFLLFFTLQILSNTQNLNKNTAEAINFSSPVRIAINQYKNLMVTDYIQSKVLFVTSKTNKIYKSIDVEGKPLGIAYAKWRLYVGNETDQCVDVYTLKGKKIRRIGGGPNPILKPNDITVDAEVKKVFVVDTIEKSVKIFSTWGKYYSKFPNPSPDFNVLANPTGITVDIRNKEIYVSDFGDVNLGVKARVQVFNYDGNLIRTISGAASSGMMGTTYRFSRPQGIAVDKSGRIYIVDSMSGQVFVYDRTNDIYLFAIGTYGTDPGQLRVPLDIVVEDLSKDVFVVNSQMKRIEIFRGAHIW